MKRLQVGILSSGLGFGAGIVREREDGAANRKVTTRRRFRLKGIPAWTRLDQVQFPREGAWEPSTFTRRKPIYRD